MFITIFLNFAVSEVAFLIQLLLTTYDDLALRETQAATWPSSYSKQLVISVTLKESHPPGYNLFLPTQILISLINDTF